MGGVARRATLISQQRAEGGFLLVVDAGDSLFNDQNPARKTQGQSSVTAMNMMGYDAMALGPKDLTLGSKALAQRIAEAQFAMLSANAVVSATGNLVAAPYTVRELGGHKVAIMGLSGGSGAGDIAVLDPLKTAQQMVAELAPQADIIILLSHAGAQVDQTIADTVAGIDLIVSGGEPLMTAAWKSQKTGTMVVRVDQALAGHAGRRVGIVRLAFDSGGVVLEQSWQRIDLGPAIADDATLNAWVQKQSAQ